MYVLNNAILESADRYEMIPVAGWLCNISPKDITTDPRFVLLSYSETFAIIDYHRALLERD